MFMTKLSKYPDVHAIHVYCDGQAALYALQSTSPMDCDLLNKCLDLIHALEGDGAMVHFTWISSHVGIPLNEKAEHLAQCGLRDATVDPGTEYRDSGLR
ncbi:hypothetical protein E2C01_028415 [Portunus trituberculatus]|uniref:Uncharacterized protein n=1 Tax=Portunus trituberculatus TaxID=210409 RepID=A0A5B7ENZ9_PORTR|nr:hypothetical protein [Portunus trituberculatus]